MRIGVLGSGQVGGTMARRLAAVGHDVMIGTRSPSQRAGAFTGIAVGTVAQAAAHGEWIVNALPGEISLDVLPTCDVDGKVILDIANYESAVDQPIVTPLGEAIQSACPGARVVKALNSVSAHLMGDPAALPQRHSVFVASNDDDARRQVTELLGNLGWTDIVDLGDLGACRAMEQLIPLWMRLEERLNGPNFNLAVIRG